MKVSVLVIMSCFATSGCVTTHYQSPQAVASGTLGVSCSKPDWLTDEFAAITCTFENKTNSWLDLEATDALTEGNQNLRALSADQTNSFLTAYKFKKTKDNANTNLVVASLVIAGLAVAAGSGHSHVGPAGLGAAAAATGYETYREVDQSVHQAQYPDYGNSHILGPKVQIPAKLFLRRSMIIQAAKKETEIGALDICLSSPQIECFTVNIEIPPAPSGPNRFSSL